MPYTILFVEDDDKIRAGTKAILRDAVFRMLQAKDGEEAVRLLEKTRCTCCSPTS